MTKKIGVEQISYTVVDISEIDFYHDDGRLLTTSEKEELTLEEFERLRFLGNWSVNSCVEDLLSNAAEQNLHWEY